jgi:hypothetical protein
MGRLYLGDTLVGLGSGPTIFDDDPDGWVPDFGAADLGGGATPIDLGSGAFQNSFYRIDDADWVTSRFRIHQGTGGAGATGLWTLADLPRPPLVLGSGAEGGNELGAGVIMDAANAYRPTPVRFVVDPGLPGGTGTVALFLDGKWNGSDEWVPVDFSFTGDDIPCHDSNPFPFTGGSIFRGWLDYQGVPA